MTVNPIEPRIKLRHLICFGEVARLRSVVNAADTLNISQPAVSKTIKELEEVLGRDLFDRSSRRIALTAAGEKFFRYSEASLASLRQGLLALRGDRDRAMLRIGALPTVSAIVLPEVVRRLTERETGFQTRIVTGPNEYLLSLLRAGEVDLMIGRMTRPDEMFGLSFEHLYFERVVVVVRPSHPLSKIKDFAPAMIEPYQLLLPPSGSVIRPLVDQVLASNGLANTRAGVETISNAFGRSYIRQTDAVWLISQGVVQRDVDEGYLTLLPLDLRDTIGPVGLTTRTNATLGLDAVAFMEVLRTVAALHRDAQPN